MDFFQQYFLEPIETGSGYNIVNTVVYAILLIVALVVLIKILKKMKIKPDNRLWTDLLPFVLVGGMLRALEDISFFPHTWLLITPGIYLLVFSLAFLSILAEKYTKIRLTRYVGLALLVLSSAAVLFNAKNWVSLALTLGLALVCFLAVFYILRLLKIRLLKNTNWQVLFAHIIDASSSFFAISYLCVGTAGYFEQHVLPSFLFGAIGAWIFVPLKIAVVLLALYVIDQETNKEWNWMLKFAVLVIGLGPGTRDLLTAFMNSSFC
jgi:uncharacterized membrane protein